MHKDQGSTRFELKTYKNREKSRDNGVGTSGRAASVKTSVLEVNEGYLQARRKEGRAGWHVRSVGPAVRLARPIGWPSRSAGPSVRRPFDPRFWCVAIVWATFPYIYIIYLFVIINHKKGRIYVSIYSIFGAVIELRVPSSAFFDVMCHNDYRGTTYSYCHHRHDGQSHSTHPIALVSVDYLHFDTSRSSRRVDQALIRHHRECYAKQVCTNDRICVFIRLYFDLAIDLIQLHYDPNLWCQA